MVTQTPSFCKTFLFAWRPHDTSCDCFFIPAAGGRVRFFAPFPFFTFIPSYLPTFLPSYLLTFLPSHLLTLPPAPDPQSLLLFPFPPSHLPTFPPSHFRTFSLSYLPTFLPSHFLTFPLSYLLTFLLLPFHTFTTLRSSASLRSTSNTFHTFYTFFLDNLGDNLEIIWGHHTNCLTEGKRNPDKSGLFIDLPRQSLFVDKSS